MNPAVAFKDLSSLCRSVILVSGTLAPMDSFAAELGTPFQHQVSTGHIIDPSQVHISVLWASRIKTYYCTVVPDVN